MPIYIDTNTGFPSEVPCPLCGWPLYCCLCGWNDDETDDDEQRQITPPAWVREATANNKRRKTWTI